MIFPCLIYLTIFSCTTEDLNRLLVDAVRVEDVASISSLLSKGADPNAKTEPEFYGSEIVAPEETVLRIALETGNEEIIGVLLDHGADIEKPDEDLKTPLVFATEKNDLRLVELILEHGAKIDAIDAAGQWNALMIAAYNNSLDQVGILVDRGANVNLKNAYGWDALMLALFREHEEMVSLLKSRGAEIDSDSRARVTFFRSLVDCEKNDFMGENEAQKYIEEKNHAGLTPMAVAAFNGCSDAIRWLKKLGTDVNARNKGRLGSNALAFAVGKKNREIVELLLNLGIDPNISLNSGQSILNLALYFGNPQYTELLIKHGADIGAKDRFGQTAIMIASFQGYADAVQVLLDAGADPWEKDIMGRDAANMALNKGHHQILKMIVNETTIKK